MSNRKYSSTENALILFLGTTLSQVITIIASPILTRLYGPESFGVFALFISISTIISVIACMRYENAILLPDSDEDAVNIFGVCIFFVILITLFVFLFIFIFQKTIVSFLNSPELAPFLWLVPISVFLSGIFVALNYWNTRTKKYIRLSASRIVTTIGMTSTQLGYGFAGFNSGGSLIGASIFGQFLGTISLTGQILREDLHLFRHKIKYIKMREVLYKYKQFPIYDSWSTLINTLSWQLPTLLLAFFFTPITVGLYALGSRVLHLPMSLIGSSIAQVFFQQASDAKRKNTLKPLVENFFCALLIISIFPILLLVFFGQDIFIVIFGSRWADAGVYCQILGFFIFFWFISSPLSTLYYVLEKQNQYAFLTILNFISRLFALIIGGILGSVLIALLLFSICGVIMYGYFCINILNYSNVSFIDVKNNLLSNLKISLLIIFPIILKILQAPLVYVVISIIVVMILYYYYIIKTDIFVKNILLQIEIIKKINKKIAVL